MSPLVIRGRMVVGGVAEGDAPLTRDTNSGWGGLDSKAGTIIERRHDLRGQSFAGKVLVFPGAKGSSGYSHYFHLARVTGTALLTMIFTRMTTKAALGAVVTRVPAMTDLDADPFALDRDGRLGEGRRRRRHDHGDQGRRCTNGPYSTGDDTPCPMKPGPCLPCSASRSRASTR